MANESTQSSSASNAGAKRRRLGKGLSGLLGDPVSIDSSTKPSVSSAPVSEDSNKIQTNNTPAARNEGRSTLGAEQSVDAGLDRSDRVVHVPLGSIIPNRFQPRSEFEASGLAELAASIRSEGVMQPVLIRPASSGGTTGGRYELIAGERRWRAAKLAGLETVPAIVRELSDESSAEWALIENVHRQDLNAMERAEAMAGLLSRFGMTQSALAEKLGLERPTVANLVRLVELEPDIRGLIASGRLGAGHGKALLSMPAGDARVRLAEQAAEGGWTVRRLEVEAKKPKLLNETPNKLGETDDQRSAVIRDIERRLGDHLGTRVAVRANADGTKGRIEIRFFDLDHFDGLLRTLGVSQSPD